MKNLLISLVLILSGGSLYAGSVAPDHVKNIFAEMFPNVEKVLWEKWDEEIVAIFNDEEGLKKVFFSDTGAWLETRKRIAPQALPLYVQTTLHERYPHLEVTYSGKIYRPQEMLYRVESESNDAVLIKIFEEGGDLLSEETIQFNMPRIHVIGYLPALPTQKIRVNAQTPVSLQKSE